MLISAARPLIVIRDMGYLHLRELLDSILNMLGKTLNCPSEFIRRAVGLRFYVIRFCPKGRLGLVS